METLQRGARVHTAAALRIRPCWRLPATNLSRTDRRVIERSFVDASAPLALVNIQSVRNPVAESSVWRGLGLDLDGSIRAANCRTDRSRMMRSVHADQRHL